MKTEDINLPRNPKVVSLAVVVKIAAVVVIEVVYNAFGGVCRFIQNERVNTNKKQLTSLVQDGINGSKEKVGNNFHTSLQCNLSIRRTRHCRHFLILFLWTQQKLLLLFGVAVRVMRHFWFGYKDS